MGAQQAFQWAVSHPDFMEKAIGIAGSAVEYPHGAIRLEGFKAAITADQTFAQGLYTTPRGLEGRRHTLGQLGHFSRVVSARTAH